MENVAKSPENGSHCIGDGRDGSGCGPVDVSGGSTCPTCGGMVLSREGWMMSEVIATIEWRYDAEIKRLVERCEAAEAERDALRIMAEGKDATMAIVLAERDALRAEVERDVPWAGPQT